ncbi:hypothetical protein [Pseudomonas profundi]|uniref:hypothetical protein n=1 Tax=Pseudomonas profundi TaxID=1981513 RepID=UPI00123BBE8D|nr:hypothetical protein [Pseudomonas profundi]
MSIDFKPCQSRCHEPLLHRTTVALVAIAASVLVTLISTDDEPVSAWNDSRLAVEPDIAWPIAETAEAGGLARYEISIDARLEIQTPVRFVF